MDNNYQEDKDNKKNSDDGGKNGKNRNVIVLLVISVVLTLLCWRAYDKISNGTKKEIPYSGFIEMLQNGEIIYGPEYFSLPADVRYEQTRFRLDFVSESEKVKKNYSYQRISEKEKQAFYEANRDLFTRYHGDSFAYEEVSVIIRKRIREMEYDKEIQNILCQLN